MTVSPDKYVCNGWKADLGRTWPGVEKEPPKWHARQMSLKGFIAGLFVGKNPTKAPEANPMKASEAMLHHIEGTGTGYELDDLVHWSPSEEAEREAIEPLLQINRDYSTPEHPLGIANPDAKEAIRALAERLRQQGL
jgi:hypothetical protein